MKKNILHFCKLCLFILALLSINATPVMAEATVFMWCGAAGEPAYVQSGGDWKLICGGSSRPFNPRQQTFSSLDAAIAFAQEAQVGTEGIWSITTNCNNQVDQLTCRQPGNPNVSTSHYGSIPASPTNLPPDLVRWLQLIVNTLSAIVGIVIAGSLVIAGMQYMTAGGNSQQVSAAKNRISLSLLSLILYVFSFAILQWLIPGGVF